MELKYKKHNVTLRILIKIPNLNLNLALNKIKKL